MASIGKLGQRVDAAFGPQARPSARRHEGHDQQNGGAAEAEAAKSGIRIHLHGLALGIRLQVPAEHFHTAPIDVLEIGKFGPVQKRLSLVELTGVGEHDPAPLHLRDIALRLHQGRAQRCP